VLLYVEPAWEDVWWDPQAHQNHLKSALVGLFTISGNEKKFANLRFRWAATEKNVRNQLKRHQYTEFQEKITMYYNQFNTKKFARWRNKNSPQIFFFIPMKWYNCYQIVRDTYGRYKKLELKAKKKDRLIKELVLKKGRYNHLLQKSELENQKRKISKDQ
jgi:DNA-directed RNA polymerase subunit N (RpoN/RPB10)